MENKELYRKLEELLPDFVFGRLSDADSEFFVQNYREFPDLVQEVKSAKSFFANLERMDFDRVFAEHTKNVSVKVNDRRGGKSKDKYRLPFMPRLVFPALGILTLFFVYITVFNTSDSKIIEIDRAGVEKLDADYNYEALDDISDEEIASIYHQQDASLGANISNIKTIETIAIDDSSGSLDEYDETLELAYSQSPDLFWGTGGGNSVSLVNEIKNISEIEFQELLEELQNNEIIY